jgi:hypothetical protein
MTIQQLKEKCDELVNNGFGETDVYFDSEAMCFDVHLIEIKDAHFIGMEVDSRNHFVLTFDPTGENSVYHYNLSDDCL